MKFIITMSITAAAIAIVAAFFSVYGLAHTFSGAFWSVVFMGGSLEAGQLVLLSFVYRFKDLIGWRMKIPATVLLISLMFLKSLGIYGYLSSAYQTDTVDMKQVNASMDMKKQEQVSLQKRKDAMDQQISQLPTRDVRGKQKLMTQFGPEMEATNNRLSALNVEIQELTTKQITTDSHVGPIVFIAKAMGLDPDHATNILILLIVFVFDPLAIFLTIATNIAVFHYEKKKESLMGEGSTSVPSPADPIKMVDLTSTMSSIDGESVQVDTNSDPTPEYPELIPSVTFDQPAEEQPTDQQPDHKIIREIDHIYNELATKPETTPIDQQMLNMIEKFRTRQNIVKQVRNGTV